MSVFKISSLVSERSKLSTSLFGRLGRIIAALSPFKKKTEAELIKLEFDRLIKELELTSDVEPLHKFVSSLKAKQDKSSMDALQQKLLDHVKPVPEEDYERFLEEKRQEFEKYILETRDVFVRLSKK